MAHFRKQIRDGIKARLQAKLDGIPVFSGRIVPFRDAELPAVNILPIGDEVADERQGGGLLLRNSDIAIVVLISGRQSETTDIADEIGEILEQAMTPAADWSLPVRKLTFLATDVAPEAGADGMLIALTHRYFAEIVHPAGKPGEPLIAAQRS